jgi:hypothetical protein
VHRVVATRSGLPTQLQQVHSGLSPSLRPPMQVEKNKKMIFVNSKTLLFLTFLILSNVTNS